MDIMDTSKLSRPTISLTPDENVVKKFLSDEREKWVKLCFEFLPELKSEDKTHNVSKTKKRTANLKNNSK